MGRGMKVKKLLAWVSLFALVGCATIIKGGNQPVSIKSNPSGAEFSIYNKDGEIVASGKTPQVVTLKKGYGYFQKARYKILIEKEGYSPKETQLEGGLGGWYIGGNCIFGGLVGWLIVDPLTGAMWTLPEETSINLSQKMSSVINQKEGLIIVLTEDIPMNLLNEIKPQMKLVN